MSQLSTGSLSDIIPANIDALVAQNGIKSDLCLLTDSNLSEMIGSLADVDNPKPVEKMNNNVLVGTDGTLYYTEDDFHESESENEEVTGCESKPVTNNRQASNVDQEVVGLEPPEKPKGSLTTEYYPGRLNFDVAFASTNNKQPWEYSPQLNKFFINWRVDFPVCFTLSERPIDMKLFIRATPVFSQAQYFTNLVTRCVGHEFAGDPSNKNVPKHVAQHVIRCQNPEARYHGDKDSGVRLNIVVPLADPQPGSGVVREFYNFQCKSSCASGMDRKPIDIIFTLEDVNGVIIGLKALSFRICSSPKRDRGKAEREVGIVHVPTKARKRMRVEDSNNHERDTTLCSLKDISIVGKENYQQVLNFCFNLMAGQAALHETTGNEPYKNCMEHLVTLMKK